MSEIAARRDWRLLALLMAPLCSVVAAALMAENEISALGTAVAMAMAILLAGAIAIGNTRQAQWTLLGLSVVFGYHTFLRVFESSHVGFEVLAGALAGIGCAIAYLLSGR